MDTLKVRDAKDVEEVVRAAVAGKQPLEIIGLGTKRAIGHPTAINAVLDLSGLNAVTAYEPNELIITVQAGAPLADVQSLIDAKNQQFAFEPMDTSVNEIEMPLQNRDTWIEGESGLRAIIPPDGRCRGRG